MSIDLLFACKVRNSYLLKILRNHVVKKSINPPSQLAQSNVSELS